uniref:FtsW/RodA/SpoVE family cell cycle protein n=1 Tax=Enterocloster sp. TaxID=2719315 RepID=UPI003FEFAF28
MAGKKRRKNRPAPAQQAVPVRRGNEQVRYVQPGRPASYPGAGQAYEQPVPQEGKKRKPRHFYDYSLLFIIIFLTVFGLVMIYSASSYTAQLSSKYNGNSAYFMQRQAMIAAIGFFIMLVISKLDYHLLAKVAVPSYALSYALMIAVSLVGRAVNGKRRWLGVGPFSFQPTEFAKIALIIMLASYITVKGDKINQWKYMRNVTIMTLPIAGLVAANNLSSGIILVGIGFVMLFVACKIKWPFYSLAALAMGILAGAGPIGKALMQIKLLQSIQKLGFLPESQNDMIFAIICEELGLFGAISIILVFLFMIFRFMVIANNAPDLFGALLVVGVMGHIAIQVVLNIAVVTNTIPNTGITLPFISYGGTSVLFIMMEMGIVLSVSNRIRLEK